MLIERTGADGVMDVVSVLGVLHALDAGLQKLTGDIGVDRLEDLFDLFNFGGRLVAAGDVVVLLVADEFGIRDEFAGRVLDA